MAVQEPARRLSEIEEVTNRVVIHPLANRLTPWLRDRGVAPNAVSLTGMACGLAAGFAYNHYQAVGWSIAGFLLMVAWHVMDGADGQLARLTGRQSETGRILDGVCDYVTFIAVYTGLAFAMIRSDGGGVWLLVALAGLAHAVQAASYEAQRQEYEFWGYGRASKNILPQTRSGGLAWLYEKIQQAAIGPTIAFHRQLDARFRADPAGLESMRQRYRDSFARPVLTWAILSSNCRTLAIFVCALLKAPLLYFLFELVGLSLVMAWLTYRQKALYAEFLSATHYS